MTNYRFIERPLYCELIIGDDVIAFSTRADAIKYVEKHELELHKFEYIYQNSKTSKQAGRGPLQG